MPDAELTEDQIKEKRRQRLMKAGYEARLRVKEEREAARLKAEADAAAELQARRDDPEGWLAGVRQKHDVCPLVLVYELLTVCCRI